MSTHPHAEPTPVEPPGAPAPIIGVDELAASLQAGPPPVILDVRWSLTGDGSTSSASIYLSGGSRCGIWPRPGSGTLR